MAVTDQTTVREFVRQVSERVREEPAIKRFWYWTGPDRFSPGYQSLQLYMLLDPDDEALHARLVHLVTELAERPENEEIGTAIVTLSGEWLDAPDVRKAIPTGAIEFPLRSR